MSSHNNVDVVVVGAGIVGMTAAYALAISEMRGGGRRIRDDRGPSSLLAGQIAGPPDDDVLTAAVAPEPVPS